MCDTGRRRFVAGCSTRIRSRARLWELCEPVFREIVMRFALARRPSPAIMAFVSLAALAGCARDEGPGPTAPVFEDARQSLGAASLACESASDIRAVIDGLSANGTLNAGRARALRTKVDQAEAHEAAGRLEEA